MKVDEIPKKKSVAVLEQRKEEEKAESKVEGVDEKEDEEYEENEDLINEIYNMNWLIQQ